ncbi:MAG: SET domain-containing protein-lysine N-methyltransferase [Chlamydiales bacterium]
MTLKISSKESSKIKEYSIQEFEEFFGLTYLKQLTFSDWRTEQSIRKKCRSAEKKRKIHPFSRWLGTYHFKELTQHMIPPVAIQWINEEIGYGLFSTKPFKQWQYIGEYTGVLRRRSLFFPNTNRYCFMYPREWISTHAYTIDSKKQGNYTRFINHDDSPNCESIAVYCQGLFHILLRTIKTISSGEELTYDYGNGYWRNRKKFQGKRL